MSRPLQYSLLFAGALFVFSGTALGQFCDVYATQKIRAQDGSHGDGFGFAVAARGDVLAVGAPYNMNGGVRGSAYIFRRAGSTWSFEQKVAPHDNPPSAEFGDAVAIGGDVLVVGMPFYSTQNNGSGFAYVYRFDGRQWNFDARLQSSTQP